MEDSHPFVFYEVGYAGFSHGRRFATSKWGLSFITIAEQVVLNSQQTEKK
jgi:hypothetical protein